MLPCLILSGGSFLFYSAIFANANDPLGMQVVSEVYAKTKQIHTLKYTMRKQERFNGKINVQMTTVKLQYNPLRVYMLQESPKLGQEVLYVEGKNDNKILVNTNGFPWVNLSLDPRGNIARENQHHTLFESGYAHLISILEHLTTKYQKNIDDMVVNKGSINWDGHACWVISFTNPYFNYYQYTVKPGETILTIAKQNKLSEHMILELNQKKVSSFTDVSPGQIIMVPNDYSPKMELYVDKLNKIPLALKIYDDKSIYEYYEYYKVEVNPTYKSNEFEKDFPGYGF